MASPWYSYFLSYFPFFSVFSGLALIGGGIWESARIGWNDFAIWFTLSLRYSFRRLFIFMYLTFCVMRSKCHQNIHKFRQCVCVPLGTCVVFEGNSEWWLPHVAQYLPALNCRCINIMCRAQNVQIYSTKLSHAQWDICVWQDTQNTHLGTGCGLTIKHSGLKSVENYLSPC